MGQPDIAAAGTPAQLPPTQMPPTRMPSAGMPSAGMPSVRMPPMSVWLPWALAGAAVATQIPYPIAPTDARRVLTIVSVLSFAAASTAHATVRRGGRWAAAYLGVAAGVGLAAEAVGVRTGWPFGVYSYSGSLGPGVVGVPFVVPLAWAMMAYPALTFARHIMGTTAGDPATATATDAADGTAASLRRSRIADTTRGVSTTDPVDGDGDSAHGTAPAATGVQPAARSRRQPAGCRQRVGCSEQVGRCRRVAGTALAGGLLLTGWDLFLDPQMVAEGHWVWAQAGPALNGVPLTNAAGWLLAGTVLTGLLAALPDRGVRRHGYPTPDHARQDHGRQDQPTSEHTTPNHPTPAQPMAEHLGSRDHPMPGDTAQDHVMPGRRTPGHPARDGTTPNHPMPDNATSDDAIPDDAIPGRPAPGHATQDDTTPNHPIPGRPRVLDDRLPFVLLGWTYFSSVLANLAFFGRPAVALAGGLGMGAVLACGILRTAGSRRRARGTTPTARPVTVIEDGSQCEESG